MPPHRKRCPPPCGKYIFRNRDEAHGCIAMLPVDERYLQLHIYECQFNPKRPLHVGHSKAQIRMIERMLKDVREAKPN